MNMRFYKIVLIHFLALEASIINEKYLNGIRETLDESVALFQNKTSIIMTKFESLKNHTFESTEIRETFDESVALLRNVTVETGHILSNKTSMIMTKIEKNFEKNEEPCDWSWERRHACAIAGFLIGFIGFPICLCCTGFQPAGVAGGSCAAGVQRLF